MRVFLTMLSVSAFILGMALTAAAQGPRPPRDEMPPAGPRHFDDQQDRGDFGRGRCPRMERGDRDYGPEAGPAMGRRGGRGEGRGPEACPRHRRGGEEGFGPGRCPRMDRGDRENGLEAGRPMGRRGEGRDIEDHPFMKRGGKQQGFGPGRGPRMGRGDQENGPEAGPPMGPSRTRRPGRLRSP